MCGCVGVCGGGGGGNSTVEVERCSPGVSTCGALATHQGVGETQVY